MTQSQAELNHEIELTKLIGGMATAYPNTQIEEATIKTYVSLLKDLPLEVIDRAIQQATSESEFFPTVARIRSKALAMMQPERISALEAWGIVKIAMSQVGFYHSPKFNDPLIEKAVNCIGWQTLCSSENEIADRAHFTKVYETLVRREDEELKLLPNVKALRDSRRPLAELIAANELSN